MNNSINLMNAAYCSNESTHTLQPQYSFRFSFVLLKREIKRVANKRETKDERK